MNCRTVGQAKLSLATALSQVRRFLLNDGNVLWLVASDATGVELIIHTDAGT